MIIKRIVGGVATLALVVALAPTAYAADPPDANLGVNLGDGTTVYTTFTPAATGQSCLDAIKAVRKDALDNGVEATDEYSGATGKTLKVYLEEKGIAEADYLNPKWSKDLEKIALVRSVELFSNGMFEHARPNGETWAEANPVAYGFNIKSGAETTYLENLAAGYQTCEASVAAWFTEKTNWQEHNGGVTGHYTTMINPHINSFGVAGSDKRFTVTKTGFAYPGIWTLASSRTKTPADEGYLGLTTEQTFAMKVKAEDVATAKLNVDKDTVIVDQTISPKVTSKDTAKKFFVRGTWSIEKPALATVDSNGVIKGVAEGKTNMVLTTEDGTKIKFPLTIRELQITAVTNPADVTTESGVAPVLPENVNVTYEDNSSGTASVTWEAVPQSKYDPLEGGEFTVNGTVSGWDKPVTVKVKVNPATIESVTHSPDTTTVESGTKPVLPTTAKVKWSNHTETTDRAITWDDIPPAKYQAREGGTFKVKGTVEGWTTPLEHTVVVNPATVTNVETPAKVTTPEKVAPKLPEKVKFTWSNGDTTEETVTWDPVNEADYATAPKTFSVNGTASGQNVSVEVEVVEAVIESVTNPAPVTTESGTAPVLPSTVKASWSNNTETDQPVTWDAIDPAKYSAREGGSFTVQGSVAGTDKKVTATVNVNPATVTAVALEDSDKNVTTPSGTKPTLPATATATWSNGDTTKEPVTWEEMTKEQYSPRSGGVFAVSGKIAGSDTELKVNVTVTAATFNGVTAPAPVTTTVGEAPKLPQTVTLTWSNGDEEQVPVHWNEPQEGQLDKPGTFTLSGVLDDYEDPVSIEVTVVAKPVKPAGTNKVSQKAKGAAALAATGTNAFALLLLAVMASLIGGGLMLRRNRQDLS